MVDVDSETGKHLSYMEFRNQTPEIRRIVQSGPTKKRLLRLYKDRLECLHGDKWVVIGSGHWEATQDSSPPLHPLEQSVLNSRPRLRALDR